MFEDINPGDLNRSIKIILPGTAEPDADGFDTVGDETLVRECKAKLSEESGTEALKSGSEFATTKYRFLVRWSSVPITTDMQIKYRPRGASEDAYYEIKRPPNAYGDSGRFMEIWTEKVEKQ